MVKLPIVRGTGRSREHSLSSQSAEKPYL